MTDGQAITNHIYGELSEDEIATVYVLAYRTLMKEIQGLESLGSLSALSDELRRRKMSPPYELVSDEIALLRDVLQDAFVRPLLLHH